jgi:uncharacterized protein YdbL (DUF1318 family)
MKIISKLFLVFSLIFSASLMAADLTSAKSAGLIGEQSNGYIGFVKAAPDDVKQLVKKVNAKRKAKYKQIAKKQKISLSDVETIGGKKAIAKTKSGNYVKRAGEGWTKK